MVWIVRRHFRDSKREQAGQVYSFIYREGTKLELRVGNGSGLPVYDAFLYYLVNPAEAKVGLTPFGGHRVRRLVPSD